MFTLSLNAQTTFSGTVDSDWSNASNWSNGLPADGNNGTIEAGAFCNMPDVTVTIDYTLKVYGTLVSPYVGELVIAENEEIQVKEGGVLSLQSPTTLARTISVDGTVHVEETLTISETGEVANEGIWQNLSGGDMIINGLFDNEGTWYTCASYASSGSITGCTRISECPSLEVCDGIDNDLDGIVDDNSCGTTFTAAVSKDITDEANWSPSFPTLQNPGTIPAGLTADATAEYFSTNYDLTVNGTLLLGELAYIFGDLTNNGTITTETTCDMNILHSVFINNGDCSGDIDLDVGILNWLENYGTMDISIFTVFSSTEVYNEGTLTVSSGFANNMFCTLYNSGTIDVTGVAATNGGDLYTCDGIWIGDDPTGNVMITTGCIGYEICDGIDNDMDGEIDEDCGCSDVTACNYDEDARLEETCTFIGCTISMACNYDPNAGCNDWELCEFDSCQGCTYASADNYDPEATIDNGSCSGTVINLCPTDVTGDGATGTDDLLMVLGAFSSTCD